MHDREAEGRGLAGGLGRRRHRDLAGQREPARLQELRRRVGRQRAGRVEQLPGAPAAPAAAAAVGSGSGGAATCQSL